MYFNWGKNKETSSITIHIIDINGKIRTNYTITYNMLKRNNTLINRNNDNNSLKCFNMVTHRFNILNVIQSYYNDIYDNWDIIKSYIIVSVIFTTLFAVFICYLIFKKCSIRKQK